MEEVFGFPDVGVPSEAAHENVFEIETGRNDAMNRRSNRFQG
jgi:hypothetical protein